MKALVVTAALSAAAALASAPETRVTHGVAANEVSSDAALIWGRCKTAADLHVEYRARNARSWQPARPMSVSADHDFTGSVALGGLTPATAYAYRVWCGGPNTRAAEKVTGSFRTAPAPDEALPVTFVWSGDVGGQNVCRDRVRGYPIMPTIVAQHPDFFIALGDMIYGDDPCRTDGRYSNTQIAGPGAAAIDTAGYWSYWKYDREDEGLRRLLAAAASYAVWDDHEVRNDFGPADDTDAAGNHLMAAGMQAFRDYNPSPGERMYRSLRWGKHVQLFLLDTRSYRERNDALDDAQKPKTLLGRDQRQWLKDGLSRSDATWKFVVSSVPLSIPTSKAKAHDGWADGGDGSGFELELLDILQSSKASGVRNQFWISTDIHFASVFRLIPFADAPQFSFYEVDTGPLHAGVFPVPEVDPSLHPQRLFLHPKVATTSGTFEQALGWFNFGKIAVDARGRLTLEIRDARGRVLYRLHLQPARS